MVSPSKTEAIGIHQSDVILRTAIIAAIADLRANPYLLDYVFAGLAQDKLTVSSYGEKELTRAKDWFLATEIPVHMTPKIDEANTPCLSLTLISSAEIAQESTLGDIHYVSEEPDYDKWPAMTAIFAVSDYSPLTGNIKVPAAIDLEVSPGMFIFDSFGNPYEILESYGDNSFDIAVGSVADFSRAVIKARKPAQITQLESAIFRENYHIGIHVNNEPVYLTWLHSIVVFILLRYKQAYLEARGFERSVISSSDFMRNEAFDKDLVFSRFIDISGYVRQYWPKLTLPTVQNIRFGDADKDGSGGLYPIDSGNYPSADPDSLLWAGSEDILDGKE